jgi:hypothetical protein
MAAFAFTWASIPVSYGRSGYNKDDDKDGKRSSSLANFGRSGYNGPVEQEAINFGRSGYNKDDAEDK